MEVKEDYKIREDETDEQYQYRISSLREQKGWTWQDVADIINAETGNAHTESKYRRDWKLICAAQDSERGEIAVKDDIEEDYKYNTEDFDLRDRYDYATDRLPYLRLMRHDARFHKFYKMIADNIQKYNPPEPVFETIEETDKEYVVTVADLHIGANFESVNNVYSIKEAERRFNLALANLENFVQKEGITKLKILSLGDIVQGILRISDLRLNEAAVVDAFVVACRLMANFLNKLSAYCEIEFLQVCYSNHDQMRNLGTKASELATEDLGKIFFAYLTDVLSLNDRVTIIGDTEHDYLEFEVFGFKCIALHGHQITNISTVVKDLSSRHHVFYDYVFLGHTHSAKEFISAEGEHHNIEVLVSSSMCGSDPYADKLMVGSKASIKVFEFDPTYGHTASRQFILN